MADILEYKCPNCGGIIEFDSSTQMMKCPYCDTTFDPAALQEMDQVLNNQQPDEMNWETPQGTFDEAEGSHMNVYSCKSCGGEIVTDATTGATHCPFCGNPVVMTGVFSGALKPDLVIPFKVSKEQAKEALKNFAKGKKLVPKFFCSESHLDEIKGVYVPTGCIPPTLTRSSTIGPPEPGPGAAEIGSTPRPPISGWNVRADSALKTFL